MFYIASINKQDISNKSLHRSTPSILCTALIKWTVNSYWLGSRTTAILFDPRTDLFPEAAGWGQQIPSRVKQNCCCRRIQSITIFYTPSFFKKFLFTLNEIAKRHLSSLTIFFSSRSTKFGKKHPWMRGTQIFIIKTIQFYNRR